MILYITLSNITQRLESLNDFSRFPANLDARLAQQDARHFCQVSCGRNIFAFKDLLQFAIAGVISRCSLYYLVVKSWRTGRNAPAILADVPGRPVYVNPCREALSCRAT